MDINITSISFSANSGKGMEGWGKTLIKSAGLDILSLLKSKLPQKYQKLKYSNTDKKKNELKNVLANTLSAIIVLASKDFLRLQC